MALSAAHSSSAFVTAPSSAISHRSLLLFNAVENSSIDNTVDADAAITYSIEQSATEASESSKLIMDIPPTQVTPAKKTPAPKKKANAAHKEGIFSPIVVAAGAVLGPEQLNKVRAKVISIHSDLIKSFVGTSDSAFGQAVLQQIFKYVDADNSGCIDKEELSVALSLLGFKWLKEKQVDAIFARADVNGDGMISLEEFMDEAPRTLKTNLVKLAKNNGGDMGALELQFIVSLTSVSERTEDEAANEDRSVQGDHAHDKLNNNRN
eukprot:scaffold2103_cov138-Skeletonema_menzelii.AAC.2